MKKLLLIAVFGLITMMNYAQETQEVYCEVIGRSTLSLTGKIKIEVDFGQENKFFSNDILKDPVTGKPMKFNSMIDALNYMADSGWIFVNAYNVSTTTSSGTSTAYHYIMKKTVTKE